MRLIRGLHNLPACSSGCVATIGAFDGVHIGHQALLDLVKKQAKRLGLPSVVIFFEPLPREYFALSESPCRLMNFRERFEAIAKLGIDYCLRIKFDKTVVEMGATAFVEQVFIDGLSLKHLVVGDDFRFGKAREGGFDMLKAASQQYGFGLESVDSVLQNGQRVSSTEIRELLQAGDFAKAAVKLGKPYTMSGKVVYGRQLGRTLGFPTANIRIRRHKSAMDGVYVVTISLPDGRCLPAMANCGTRPTVDDEITAILEVYIFDFAEQIYGQRVTVQFKHKLREEQKFESLPALAAAITQDAERAKAWLATAENAL